MIIGRGTILQHKITGTTVQVSSRGHNSEDGEYIRVNELGAAPAEPWVYIASTMKLGSEELSAWWETIGSAPNIEDKRESPSLYKTILGVAKEWADADGDDGSADNEIESVRREIDSHLISLRPKPQSERSPYDDTIGEYTCRALVHRALRAEMRRNKKGHAWVLAKELFAVSFTSASEICRACGIDPDHDYFLDNDTSRSET